MSDLLDRKAIAVAYEKAESAIQLPVNGFTRTDGPTTRLTVEERESLRLILAMGVVAYDASNSEIDRVCGSLRRSPIASGFRHYGESAILYQPRHRFLDCGEG